MLVLTLAAYSGNFVLDYVQRFMYTFMCIFHSARPEGFFVSDVDLSHVFFSVLLQASLLLGFFRSLTCHCGGCVWQRGGDT